MDDGKCSVLADDRLVQIRQLIQIFTSYIQFFLAANDCAGKPDRCPDYIRARGQCYCPGEVKVKLACENGQWKPLPCGKYKQQHVHVSYTTQAGKAENYMPKIYKTQ